MLTNWIVPYTLHQCLKYIDDKATVRTVFAETQPFKGVKNYFTDFLLYRETGKVVKELLPETSTTTMMRTLNQERTERLPLS